ncbi:MAG: hypothetical protein AB3P11_03875 [Wolbachia pipientis]
MIQILLDLIVFNVLHDEFLVFRFIMPDFGFSDLKDIVNALYDSYYLPSNGKIKLAELLEDVLQLKGKKKPEEVISILKDQIRSELKNEIKSEMKQKINKLEQLEEENKDLQAKKDKAEWLNRALEHAKDRAHNENIELKNKLNIQIQQLEKESENKNETIKQLTRTATISVGLVVGLATYIALEHTVRIMIGIAIVSALIAIGLTYLALKPSSQVSGTQEPQGVANNSLI